MSAPGESAEAAAAPSQDGSPKEPASPGQQKPGLEMSYYDLLKELQCTFCHELIKDPVHAHCGHSFCHSHLAVDEAEAERVSAELLAAAAQLRRLVAELGLPEKRAREALALAPNNPKRAELLCRKAAGLEGRAVRVRDTVKEPRYLWGAVTHNSVGVVQSVDDTGNAYVDFPEQRRWRCHVDELEVECVADGLSVGQTVRLRAGLRLRRQGPGALECDAAGQLALRHGHAVHVQVGPALWVGHVGELEPVPDLQQGSRDAMVQAVARLAANRDGPPPVALAELWALVSEAAAGKAVRARLTSTRRRAMCEACGAAAFLRAAGFDVRPGTREGLNALTATVSIRSTPACTPKLAQEACEVLRASFGAIPARPVLRDVRVSLAAAGDAGRKPFADLWRDGLRKTVLQALGPDGETWTWADRGLDVRNDEELCRYLQEALEKGPAVVARGQPLEEAELLSRRLAEGGALHAEAVEPDDAERGEAEAEGQQAEPHVPASWLGRFRAGAFVRLRQGADTSPLNLEKLVGVVAGQWVDATGTLKYSVHFAGILGHSFKEDDLIAATEAEAIKPGVKVKVRTSGDPQFGWGQAQSLDVGVVHSVQFDGKVWVYWPAALELWACGLQDLDTANLPPPSRPCCPVCQTKFPPGERLAVDRVMQAQIQRLQKLLQAGGQPEAVAPLLRSNSQQSELTCAICFDLLVTPVSLSCGHSFCKTHIEQWLQRNSSCPVCKQRVNFANAAPQKSSEVCYATGLFGVALYEDREGGDGPKERPQLQVNQMLQNQMVRFFPTELKGRAAELAEEVWGSIQKDEPGYLDRLRGLFQQFGQSALLHLEWLGLVDANMRLPSSRGGTVLMVAAELGLTPVAEELVRRRADPLLTTESPFGAGSCTALSLASAAGHDETLELLLASADWPEAHHADALGAAVARRRGKCIERLLARTGASEFVNHLGLTALLTAVQCGHVEELQTLAARGAQLESRTTLSAVLVAGASRAKVNGLYRLFPDAKRRGHWIYKNEFGACLYCNGWWKICEVESQVRSAWLFSAPEPRVETGEPPPGRWTTYGYLDTEAPPFVSRLHGGDHAATPLLLAAQLGHVGAARMLLEARADAEASVGASGRSALHISTVDGNVELVSVLLPHTLHKLDVEGLSPLHLACQGGRSEIARLLLDASADVGRTGTSAAGAGTESDAPSPLMLASRCGHRTMEAAAAELLPDAGCYLSLVQELLRRGADPTWRCGEKHGGGTALHCAASGNAGAEIVGALLEARCSPSSPVDARGLSALLVAMLSGNAEVVRALTAAGADTAAADPEGLTTLMAAAMAGNEEVLDRLASDTAPELFGKMVRQKRQRLSPASEAMALHASAGDAGWSCLRRLVAAGASWLGCGPRCRASHRMQCTTWSVHLRCDKCSGHRKKDSESIIWSCRPCNYDLCPSCAGMPPIVLAPRPHPEHVDKVLDEACNNGVDLTTTELEGWTALHYAVAAGHKGVVVRLLALRAQSAAADAAGRTALHWAASFGHADVVEALLQVRGAAEAQTTDSSGEVALQLAPLEMLRFAFELPLTRHEKGLPAPRVHVSGAGDSAADGVYVRRGLVRNGRQTYIRYGEPAWAISWENGAWGIFRERFHKDCLKYQSRHPTPFCPAEGWEPAGAPEPAPTLANGPPWCAGDALVKATPVKFRSQSLQDSIAHLPQAEQPAPEVPLGAPAGRPGEVAVPMPLPPGLDLHLFEQLLAEMARRGELPDGHCVHQ